MIVTILVLCAVVVALIYAYRLSYTNCREWQLLKQFPGDTPWPIIGNALKLGFNADEATKKLIKMWEKHGYQNFRVIVGSEKWILLTDPDDIAILLSHDTELFKPLERNVALMPFFGNSLSSSQGEKWRSMRKLMTSAFQYKFLDRQLIKINELCNSLIETLAPYEGNGVINFYRVLGPHMLDIICETLMGVEAHYLRDSDHYYLNASTNIIRIATLRYFSNWRQHDILSKYSSDFQHMKNCIKSIKSNSNSIINKRRKIIEENTKTSKKFDSNIDEDQTDMFLLDVLLTSKLSNGDPLPEHMIREEVDLLTFTGHYTTMVTVSHALFYIANHPEVQHRLYEEQRSISKNDTSKCITYQEIKDMKYLEVVIKESMRMLPPLGEIGRQLQNELTLKGDAYNDGRIIPAGTSSIVFYKGLFHNPKIYKDPHLFNPDRFFEALHPFAFVPFSAGPRNCIGSRFAWTAMKTTLSKIIRNFEIMNGGPGNQPEFAMRIITESKNGINLKLKKR